MAIYTNLKKFIFNYTADDYDPNTEKGWKSGNIDSIDVWYMEIIVRIHGIREPICNVYKEVSNINYQQFIPYKIEIATDNITIYIRKDTSPNKLAGKVIIL